MVLPSGERPKQSEPAKIISSSSLNPNIAGTLGFVVKDRATFYLEEWSDGTTRLRNIYMAPDNIQVADEGLHILSPEQLKTVETLQQQNQVKK